MNLSVKQKQTHRHREQTCGCQRVSGQGRVGLGVWDTLYIEWINKVLLYSTGNYIQYPVINHPKGDQSWVFTGRTDAEAATPIFWPPHAKS